MNSIQNMIICCRTAIPNRHDATPIWMIPSNTMFPWTPCNQTYRQTQSFPTGPNQRTGVGETTRGKTHRDCFGILTKNINGNLDEICKSIRPFQNQISVVIRAGGGFCRNGAMGVHAHKGRKALNHGMFCESVYHTVDICSFLSGRVSR